MGRASLILEKSKKPGRPSSEPPWHFATGIGGGVVSAWTDSRIEQVRHFKSWVFVAISRIADAFAKSTPNVSILRSAHDLTEKQRRRILSPHARSKALTPMQEHDELEPVGRDHPLQRLMHDPNVEDTAFDLWWETMLYFHLTGSAYWWTPPNRANLPLAIYVLPSHWVWPVADTNGRINGYQLRPVEGFWQGEVIPKEDVIHFKKKSPISKWDGYSPMTAGNMWIDCSEAMDRARYNSFRNGIIPGMIFHFDGTRADPQEEELKRIRSKLQEVYAGEQRTNMPLLLPPGMDAKPLGMVVKEMEFGTSFEQMARAVLSLFGVPLSVTGWTKEATFGSLLASHAGFTEFTINPLATYMGQQITEKLAWRYDEKLLVWWPDQTPQDPQALEQSLRTDMAGGVRTRNEHRHVRGLKPMDGPKGEELCFSKPQQQKPQKAGDGGIKPDEPNYSHGDGSNDSGTATGKELARFSLNGKH